ncbi:MAG: hypothetical protein A3H52_01990 [Candidatus Zambryskibacteria bacterium RIFCSPLOWO2_02_FULL_39_26]|uniref:Uncharacterized protein n=1 Tax=Candidatus Zambryskibacteria bacterium RIFCSPLOWO2_12_FULL_39_23 TaxID=1802776 RepID=A0A1G2UR82_9BACT|nr:MAG: hypothetical protein A3E59_01635 [Candidatus Zambryskibacteria bacterium RIFCSPHIGHO2_12_FULL_39_47]OHB10064.1 MAG: hypothetical protein A3H52_01990 [Candidatus Zambryskibacteria bacterium RIFCSPLOWO2_02_FULL_39_26]OHB11894.1 MAG: hypothetical protein A3G99_01050 [Candidatus Zambryskibacteria bacterium RIFCSPLOWO2_12_FULL_39_23]
MINGLNNKNIKKSSQGFSFVELIVGMAVFLTIIIAVYDSYISVFNVVGASRAKIEAVSLINEQFEIVRNLTYSNVGVAGSIPSGVLLHTQTLVRDNYSYEVTTTVRNIDDPFDGSIGGTPNDLSPADYKVVEIEINCNNCKTFVPMVVTTNVAPKNLETASANGALFVRVFDANGNPVSGANIHIENNQTSPTVVIDDVTNNSGMLQIVDAPPGVNAYEITVTKSGYSTDKTYTESPSNPNPTNPHATVVLQQVTQLSFVIDRLSAFNVTSVTETCSSVGSVDFNLLGSKIIGTNPTVIKYNQNKITDAGGSLNVSDIEWDSYLITLIDGVYELVGINPILPVGVIPNSSQNLQLVVAPKNPQTLLVTVKDSATGLPLSGVTVILTKAGFSATSITGQGFLGQTDWSGGSGQATSTDPTMYLSSDGNIETNNPAGDIKLKQIFGEYISSGFLISSSFNAGSPSNFQEVSWNPIDQPPAGGVPNVRVQLATNNNGGTWNFAGPDGTDNTYYTTADQNISSINNSKQYIRYKIFLDSVATSTSPNISDISMTFTRECTPPGQVSFSGLSSGTYNMNLAKTGYASQDISVDLNSNWQSQEVIFMPN